MKMSQIATLKVNGQSIREPETRYVHKKTGTMVYVQRVYHHGGEKYIEGMMNGHAVSMRRSSIKVG